MNSNCRFALWAASLWMHFRPTSYSGTFWSVCLKCSKTIELLWCIVRLHVRWDMSNASLWWHVFLMHVIQSNKRFARRQGVVTQCSAALQDPPCFAYVCNMCASDMLVFLWSSIVAIAFKLFRNVWTHCGPFHENMEKQHCKIQA